MFQLILTTGKNVFLQIPLWIFNKIYYIVPQVQILQTSNYTSQVMQVKLAVTSIYT